MASNAAPVAYTPPDLLSLWPGGEPPFPVDSAFYLAVQRAELAHLAHYAKALHGLMVHGELPEELHDLATTLAIYISIHEQSLRFYERKWSHEFGDPPVTRLPWEAFRHSVFCLLRELEDRHEPPGEGAALKFARRISTPTMLLKYRTILGLAPDLRIDPEDFPWKREAPAAPEGIADAPGGPEPAATPRDQGKADRCLGLYVAAIQEGRTPPSVTELAATVGCSTGTASRAIRPLEDKRKGFARQDAATRYRDHDNDEDVA